MEIPKIIHQTWKNNDFPSLIARCVRSIIDSNPNWEHILYTDEMWEDILETHSILDREDFFRFPTGIQKADIFRCLILYEKGGLYSDIDVVALRPIDSLIDAAKECGLVRDETEIILTTDHPIHSRSLYGNREILMNNFMLASPKSKFMRIFLEEISEFSRSSDYISPEILNTTGPLALTRFIKKHGGVNELNIAVLPYFWINPLPDITLEFPERSIFLELITTGSWREKICPYFVHLWWHSYMTGKDAQSLYENVIDTSLSALRAKYSFCGK